MGIKRGWLLIRGERDDYYRGAYIYARYPPEMRITRSKVTVLSLLIMGTWHNSKLAYFLLRPSKLEMATVEVGCLLRPDSICSSHLVSVTAGMIARLFWSAHRATACVSARSQRGSYLPSTSVRVLATPEITPASYPTYADEGAHRTLDLLDEGV